MVRFRLGILVLLLVASGCDRAWQAYERIELGAPIPENNLIAVEGVAKDDECGWQDSAITSVPRIAATLRVSAKLDHDGRVQAKVYDAHASGHWLLCGTTACRTVMEAELPEELFQALPADAQDESESLSGQALADAAEHLDHTMNKCPRALSDQPTAFNSADYCGQLFAYGMGLHTSVTTEALRDLSLHADHLANMADAGFDWTYHGHFGGTLRVQGLGGRRVRVEAKYFRILDPFMLIARLEMGARRDVDVHTRDVEVRTIIE